MKINGNSFDHAYLQLAALRERIASGEITVKLP
jgi:hypothetical protein